MIFFLTNKINAIAIAKQRLGTCMRLSEEVGGGLLKRYPNTIFNISVTYE
jgi:hypothetical protein